jgi:hypothetical protein
MQDHRREILAQVAAGSITAEEGAARLESLESERHAAPSATAPVAPEPPAAAGAPTTRRVKVISQFGSAEIVGDPSVAYAVADGPHQARQDGDTLVIEHVPFDASDSFSFGRGDRQVLVNGLDIQRRRLTVRMHPDLALVANVQAGNVIIRGVHGPISSEVQAGNCKLDDFRGPVDLVVQAGNISAGGRLDAGASQVRCEMGSVRIKLERGSSVRVTAKTTLGKVSVEGEGGDRAVRSQGGREVTIGSGSATLDIDCTMGNVRVSAD